MGFYQDEMSELTSVKDRVVRQPSSRARSWRRSLGSPQGAPACGAGRDEYRVHNKADELSKYHYRRVVEILDELFRTGGYDLLIIGGHDYEVRAFMEFLTRQLSDKVAGSFSIEPTAAALAEIRTSAASIVQGYERDRERRLVAEILDRSAVGGLAAVGLAPGLWAGSVAAIQKLLVEDGVTVSGVVCDESDWLALDGDKCPLCGKPTRRTPDVIDALVHTVIAEGGSVEHVGADTKLEEYTLAAALRSRLPPLPQPGT
jgi:peptide subunit release factor 1 (eRF1)